MVPTLAKFYHEASESYEQACTRHINVIIFYQFERLFQFVRRIEDWMYTIPPEEILILTGELQNVYPQRHHQFQNQDSLEKQMSKQETYPDDNASH
ncbi:exocyst complex component SEC3A-like [Solanum lycopersicum]|uniref:exocyst complex component SEC3A-like n=1 Tax=Solanum lycopersicum TaxID=4081 RepID=UPI00374A5EED